MTGQGVLFKLGAELLEQPELPFTDAAAGDQPAAAAAPLVIVGCGKGKQDRPARARDLYTGQQYRACMATAEALTEPGRIRILSAAHGLLELDTETAPYDVRMGAVGSVTVHQLRGQAERAGLLGGRVIILAGADYTALCRGVWPDAETPLAGLGIGQQRARLAAMRREAAAADPDRITNQRAAAAAAAAEPELYVLIVLDMADDERRPVDVCEALRHALERGAATGYLERVLDVEDLPPNTRILAPGERNGRA